jgi:Flp pilus assembly pilin Flp
MSELGYLTSLWSYYLVRMHESRDDETGAMTTETAIITAILAGLALAVGAIIVTKVTTKAESIPTN